MRAGVRMTLVLGADATKVARNLGFGRAIGAKP